MSAFTGHTIDRFAGHGAGRAYHSDNGSAYRSRGFSDPLVGHGIKHKPTKLYTPRAPTARPGGQAVNQTGQRE